MVRFIDMRFSAPIIVLSTAVISTCSALAQPKADPGWTSLFDGTSLDGWVQRGGKASYKVEDGCIVGTTVPNTPNSFLCTEKDYGDFIFECEFWCHPELNSGVQYRSRSLPEYQNGRVHGYQAEIDPSDRGWTCGFYEEGRRKWLHDLSTNHQGRYAFKQDTWNRMRIEAIGDSIRIYLNGVQTFDQVDSHTLSGFIGLQVHGVGKREDPLWVKFRNLRIKDLGVSEWRSLLDDDSGVSFESTVEDAWQPRPEGGVHGRSAKEEKRHAILLSDKEFSDQTLRINYRANKGNSGLYFRCLADNSAVKVKGFQAEIDANGSSVGGLYETQGRAWVVQPDQALLTKIYRKNDWNQMTVSAHGTRVVVHLNGAKTSELRDDRKGRLEGKIGMQLHGGQEMDIEIADLEILHTPSGRPKNVAPPKLEPKTKLVFGEPVQVSTGFKFTEGPSISPDGSVFFTDIPNEKIHVYDPDTGETAEFVSNSGNANGLFFAPSGALLACEMGGRQVVRYLSDGSKTTLIDAFEETPLNQPNDLVLDGKGGLYFTDPIYRPVEPDLDFEGLFYMPKNGKRLLAVDKELMKPNGVAINSDGTTLYVVDNGAKKLYAYDITNDGYHSSWGERRLLAELTSDKQRSGDGMCLDIDGNLYVTVTQGVRVFDPEGTELALIELPEQPANCIFGGPDGSTLFVTARTSLYQIDTNTRGQYTAAPSAQ